MVDEKNKKGLGRGLMSLFGDQDEVSNNIEKLEQRGEVNSPYLLASIGDLVRSRFQPRIYFDDKKLAKLVYEMYGT